MTTQRKYRELFHDFCERREVPGQIVDIKTACLNWKLLLIAGVMWGAIIGLCWLALK